MQHHAHITCEVRFEASHQLHREDWSDAENDTVFGNCARLHGHSYRLLVTLRGPIDPETGMVVNFRDVKATLQREIVARLDHRHLNEVVDGLTTAENLCHWIAARLLPEFGLMLSRVELGETPTAAAFLTETELAVLLAELTPRLAVS